MESILSECPNTVVFIDDIMIWGATEKEHDEAVRKTLAVLKSFGIMLNMQKCKFKQEETTFLGHKFSEKEFFRLTQKFDPSCSSEHLRARKN